MHTDVWTDIDTATPFRREVGYNKHRLSQNNNHETILFSGSLRLWKLECNSVVAKPILRHKQKVIAQISRRIRQLGQCANFA